MPMTSDEHAKLLMQQNNRRLARRAMLFMTPLLALCVVATGLSFFTSNTSLSVPLFIFSAMALISLFVTNASLPWQRGRAILRQSLNRDPQFAKRYAMEQEWTPRDVYSPSHTDQAGIVDEFEKEKWKSKPKRMG
jgi:hypothetical protein